VGKKKIPALAGQGEVIERKGGDYKKTVLNTSAILILN